MRSRRCIARSANRVFSTVLRIAKLDLLQKTLVGGSESRLYVTDGVEALNGRDYKDARVTSFNIYPRHMKTWLQIPKLP